MSTNPLHLPQWPAGKHDWRGRLLLLAARLLGFASRGATVRSRSRGTIEAVLLGRREEATWALIEQSAHAYNLHRFGQLLQEVRQDAAEAQALEDWSVTPDETVH